MSELAIISDFEKLKTELFDISSKPWDRSESHPLVQQAVILADYLSTHKKLSREEESAVRSFAMTIEDHPDLLDEIMGILGTRLARLSK